MQKTLDNCFCLWYHYSTKKLHLSIGGRKKLQQKGGKTMNESRNTATAPLSEQAKEARRAYQKKWRKNNPDKVKAIQQRHWEKKARETMTESGEKEGDE
jgi:hypothetical protein